MDSASFRSSARVMRCKFEFFLHAQNVSVAPPMVPSDIAPLLLVLHSQPAVWFLGQLARYITRPLPWFESELNALASTSKLSHNRNSPIVGVHVRRTDKVSHKEAKFHNLSEYMVHVDRYFDYVEQIRLLDTKKDESRKPEVQRQIYLASDDISVFSDMKRQYSHYIVHNMTKNKLIVAAGGRFQTDKQTHIAIEIYLLSLTDYIVCTVSSNVCRVAYELMQTRQSEIGDAGELIQTVDTSYFWDSGQLIKCEMVQNEETMNLHTGDVVDVWNGNLNAPFEHQRLRNKTYFVDPSYKCVPRTIIGEMQDNLVE
ncbi:unnamed protein product [Calicophoron daubneyi]|uniref:GT23 domain-containing protein n=1 Tax=Calicophoron daubneyi TaxID=300641 RepID=A0AAV2TEX7_CALDB